MDMNSPFRKGAKANFSRLDLGRTIKEYKSSGSSVSLSWNFPVCFNANARGVNSEALRGTNTVSMQANSEPTAL